ncbi:MAG: ABC transporter permease [Patescibacteria group bacterium]
MRTKDLIEEIIFGVSANKARSGLTMLGIVIGIASVIAMLAIGQGSKDSIETNIQSIGSNLLIVMPGMQRTPGSTVSSGRGAASTLTLADAKALESLQGVSAVAPDVSRRSQVIARGTNTNTQIEGTTPEYLQVRNVAIDLGAFFTGAQVSSRAKVAVIGPTTRDDLFGEGADPVGEKIRINGMNFLIIGVTAAKGGSGTSNQDDAIYIPITTVQAFITGSESVSTISVGATDSKSMTDVQAAITSLLLERHKISDAASADFSVLNQSDLVSIASSITGTFTTLLAAIAGISLIVGGIGIMNMMLTAVTERTREIGLRKAVGSERRSIVGQFLGEAVLLTMVGGGAGVALGYVIALIITKFSGTATHVATSSVLLAFGVSAIIGIVFGFYPAQRASKLDPIQALRYE